jgi:hypothetical protein
MPRMRRSPSRKPITTEKRRSRGKFRDGTSASLGLPAICKKVASWPSGNDHSGKSYRRVGSMLIYLFLDEGVFFWHTFSASNAATDLSYAPSNTDSRSMK